MGEFKDPRSRFSVSLQQLRYGGAGLAVLVAFLHLFHPNLGFPRLMLILSVDPSLLVSHPRPLTFTASGIAIIVAVMLVWFGAPRKPIYALGMALMVTFIVGYFAWHFTGHGGFLPGRGAYGHGELGPLENVIAHLASDAWARASKLAETALLIVLAVLYYRER